jgi:hypothetical protein
LRTATALAAALLAWGAPLRAQNDAPDGQVMGTRDNRILWIFPNYMTVDEERSVPSITSREKALIAVKDSFDPYAFPIAGAFAGINYAQDRDASWGRGADKYAKLYFAAFADQTMSNMMSEAVFPVVLRQDPRFFRLGRGGIWHRAGYAVTRVFVTRSDSGEPQFNYSEFGGNAVMAAASDLYYPRDDRAVGDAATRFGTQIGFDLFANIGKEFWPDVKRWLTGRD